MFTGLVEAQGRVIALVRRPGGVGLQVSAPFAGQLTRGDSVAINGACLTAVELWPDRFSADVSQESLDRTTLGALQPGATVNLERALAVGQRLGGHYVLGHVDGVGRVLSVSQAGEARRVDIEFPAEMAPLFIEKGSVAVDGISLTVNQVSGRSFWVAVIPETQARTSLGRVRAGDKVNLEGDVLGKYVLRALATRGSVGVTPELLARSGYL